MKLVAVVPRSGRVFVSIPGHYSWTFGDPLFRILLLRGIAWSAGEPVDRFNPLGLLTPEPRISGRRAIYHRWLCSTFGLICMDEQATHQDQQVFDVRLAAQSRNDRYAA